MLTYYLTIALLTVHALSGVFWAGSTSAMANLGDANAARLFPFQMGSAAVAVLTGLTLWAVNLGASLGMHEQILLFGILAAILAAGVQGNVIGRARRELVAEARDVQAGIVGRMTRANRAAAGLLAITVACMIVSKFF